MTVRTLTLILAMFCLLAGSCHSEPDDGLETVTIKDQTFSLEVAAEEEVRNRGLGGRESIPEHGGMIFVFPEPQILSFYMKDCLTDIDIIFVDSRGRITALHSMPKQPPRGANETENDYLLRLPTYSSGTRAVAAIELRAGWINKLDLHVQDQIALVIDRLKGLAK